MIQKTREIKIYYHLHIKYSFKNTIIYLTKNNGELIKQWSTKSLKKIEKRKNTPYNIQLLCSQIYKYLKTKKINYFKLILFGKKNYKRKFIFRNLKIRKFKVFSVHDHTPISYNGCRPKKQRRK